MLKICLECASFCVASFLLNFNLSDSQTNNPDLAQNCYCKILLSLVLWNFEICLLKLTVNVKISYELQIELNIFAIIGVQAFATPIFALRVCLWAHFFSFSFFVYLYVKFIFNFSPSLFFLFCQNLAIINSITQHPKINT